MDVNFKLENLSDFKANIHREWVLTNGLGGYAGSSCLGAHNRTHQGLLIASLHPPVERYLVFSKNDEKLIVGEEVFDLTTAQYLGEDDRTDAFAANKGKAGLHTAYKCGNRYLESFSYDGTVCFNYAAGAIKMSKTIALRYGENTCAILYRINNSGPAGKLVITPLMNCREHSASQTREGLVEEFGDCLPEMQCDASGKVCMIFRPRTLTQKGFETVVEADCGSVSERADKYFLNMQLQTEVDNEVDGLDSHYCPVDIEVELPAHSERVVSFVVKLKENKCATQERKCKRGLDATSAGNAPNTPAEEIITLEKERTAQIINKGLLREDKFASELTLAADKFIVYRSSTGLSTVMAGLPWFTDWGRDTMIALTGLTLVTGRLKEARDILKTFAKYVRNGMVPNMFPDDGQEPLYNTADASLWYFYAVYKFLEYTRKYDTELTYEEALEFVKTEIYPGLKEIIEAYKTGTDFSIYMEEDGLIHAGSGLDQVTWMDVRVGDWVATPRHGKPVEINALWYNALMVMAELSELFEDQGDRYRELAGLVKISFNREFIDEKTGWLYDVVDGAFYDDTLRPNQIYAVSLPFTMLDEKTEKRIVDVVLERLYVGCGLRSLDREHTDYHPIYLGSLDKRDHAYHQGTAWGFLLGGFITAYVKVYGRDNLQRAKKEALSMLEPVKAHLYENCIGSICEIFDGDAPNLGRGCYAQAWSVGEVLRCYFEDLNS